MFTQTELQILLVALDAEADWLRAAERHNLTVIRQTAAVSVLKAKIADALDAETKKAAAAAKETP